MKVLYNDCYGSFGFSEPFLAEYKTRTGVALNLHLILFRVGPNSVRVDPVAIAIVEEKGTEWSSGPESEVRVYDFPDVFERYWEIEESGGDECVHIDVNAALADCLRTYMDTKDSAALSDQYNRITAAQKKLFGSVLKQEMKAPVNEYGSYFEASR